METILITLQQDHEMSSHCLSGSCGGEFNNVIGHMSSPSYPNNYQANGDCIYTIAQPHGAGIMLTFLNMDIQYDLKCRYDYLEIRDGPLPYSPLIKKICGGEIPTSLQSSQNQIWMK